MKNKDTKALEMMSHLKNYNKFVQLIIKRHINEGEVLDFGCGRGDFAKHLNDSGYKCDGVEVDKKAVLESQKKSIKVFNSLSEVKKLYPTVISLNVLEHIEDDIEVLKNLFNIIENDGSLVLYLPASMAAWSNMDVEVGHYRRYSKKEIIHKLHTTGYNVTHSSYKDFSGWLTLIIFRLLRVKLHFNEELITFYDRFIFPFAKFLDLLGSFFIGKNILIVAKVRK
ncbi:class I SAM-dependent methyltransferase [Acidimicrobiia bacterium]|jgi:SAM-dependent methyltransferase|nr:class I SAM-dependent methyltransferase [Acidimicrobiia bacterium]